jgi:hypothetical protein
MTDPPVAADNEGSCASARAAASTERRPPLDAESRLMDFDERDLVAVAADTSFRNIHPLAVVML